VLAHTTEPMKSTDNRAILPKGTKLTGHHAGVVASDWRHRNHGGDEVDKAVLKGGQEVPLANFAIQALAAPSSAPSSLAGDNDRISAPRPCRLIIRLRIIRVCRAAAGRGRKAHRIRNPIRTRNPTARAPPQQRQMPQGRWPRTRARVWNRRPAFDDGREQYRRIGDRIQRKKLAFG